MARIMVTGAAGALGTCVVQHLLEHKCEAIRVGRGAANDVRADLLEAGVAGALVEQVAPDAIIHLAWETTHGAYWADPANERWAAASIDMAQAAARKNCWFGFAGTCAEYEWGSTAPLSVDETPTVPATLYGAQKLRVTQALETLPGTFAGRIFFPFGPHENAARITSLTLRKLRAGEALHLRAGDVWRDLAATNDVAASFVAAALKGTTGTHNLATGQATHLGEFLGQLAERLGRRELLSWDEYDSATVSEPQHLVAHVEPVAGVLPIAFDAKAGLDAMLA